MLNSKSGPQNQPSATSQVWSVGVNVGFTSFCVTFWPKLPKFPKEIASAAEKKKLIAMDATRRIVIDSRIGRRRMCFGTLPAARKKPKRKKLRQDGGRK